MLAVLTACAPALALPQNLNWQFAGWHGGGAFPMIVPDPAVAGRTYLISDIGGIWQSDNRGDQWNPRTNGLGNLKIVNLAIAPSNSNILYCGTSIGVHRSDNAGQDWVISAASKSKILFSRPSDYRSLVVHPTDPNRVYAGTKDGQVFYTADGGGTWANLGVQLPFGSAVAISSLLCTRDGAYLFAASPSGLRRYNFASAAWETTTFPAGAVYDLTSDGTPETIFATTGTKIAWSQNAGASWQLSAAAAVPSPGYFYRVSAKVTAQGTRLLAAWRENWNGGVFLSTDGGTTWTNVERNLSHDTQGDPTRVWHTGFEWPLGAAIDPANPSILYFSDFWGAWRSDDGGQSWQEKVRGAPNSVGSDVQQSADGRLWVATMDNGLMVSSDNGAHYQALAPNSASDTSVMGHVWRVIARGNHVVATNSPWDAGPNQVLVSENGGTSFTKTRSGLPTAYPTTNVVWDKGYARALAQDPVQTNRFYLGIDGDGTGGFFYSVDGGYNWTRSAGQPSSLRIYNGLAVDPVEPYRLYWATVGTGGGVYRSENYGLNWLKVFSGSAYVFDLAVAPDGTVYAGTDTAGPVLFVSRNKGTSWSQLKAFGGSGTCEGIAIDPTNSSRLAVSTLKWDGYTPCKIYLSEDAGATWTDVSANLPYGSGASAMAFSPDGRYLNIVRDAGSAWRLSLVNDAVAPTAPGSLTATAGAGSVNLSWTASTDDTAVTGYKVYRGGTFLMDSASTSCVDSSVSLGASYSYTVKATDAAGNLSAASSAANVTLADTTAPSAPQNLTYTLSGERTVNLAWSASTDNGTVARYDVYRNGIVIGQSAAPSYADSSGAYGAPYAYAVKAVDAAGNTSAASASVSVTLSDTTPPGAPQGLTVFVLSAVTVSWQAPTDNVGVAGYRVYRNSILLSNCASTSYTDTLAAAGVSYAYEVTALDAAGNESAKSAPVTALIADAAPPTAPSSLAAALSGTSATLSWNPSQDDTAVTGYKIYRDQTLLTTVTASPYTDSILVPGTQEELRPGASAYFNGASMVTFSVSPDWDFGSGDFTIDHWYRFDSLQHTYFWSRLGNGGSGTELALRWITSNQIDVYIDDVPVVTAGWRPVTGVWYHLAVSRSGGAVRFFVNGVQVGATGTSNSS
ncbi:MAG TPA: LamG-like jellyroll fold domain-containing protein, partial [Candidatus Eisenbacteria bacterium]|nr:LamG-like jellyroll fold domain-containing protein [Candidatus Eisenbacteria bacterium]